MDNNTIDSTTAALMEETAPQGTPQAAAAEPLAQTQPNAAAPVPTTEYYEVKVNGQTHKVPLSELTAGYSRHSDYSRKTQELAEERRQITAEVNQYRQQIAEAQQFFADPKVQQALAGMQAGVTDPNQPLTAQQVQQLLQSQQQRVQQQQDQVMQQKMQELEVKTLSHSYNQEFIQTLKALKTQFPVLEDLPGFETVIRQQVAERQPQTLDEAKAAFSEIASGIAQKLESRFAVQQKQAAVQQAKIIKGGIEPPGGTVEGMPAETKFKLGQPDLINIAIQDLMNASSK